MEKRLFRVSHLLLFILSCSFITSLDINLMDDHFKIASCTSRNVQTVLKMIPAKTTHANSILHCAITCLETELCKYAIFNKMPRTCELVYGLTNTIRPIIDQTYLLTDEETAAIANNCSVLARIVTSPWTRIKLRDVPTLGNLDRFADMKLGRDTESGKKRFHPVSQFIVGESGGGYTIVTDANVMSIIVKNDPQNGVYFFSPYKNRIVYVYNHDNATGHEGFNAALSLKDGKAVTSRKSASEESYPIVMKHVDLVSGVRLENNFRDAMLSILAYGYRRLDRHPTRIQFDAFINEVHLDVTQTVFVKDPGTQPRAPCYFQSIKETFTTDSSQSTRYTLKHQIFKSLEQKMKEETVLEPYPWVLELSWKREPDLTQLSSGIRQGKSIRILMQGQIFTDTTAVYLTPENIMVATAPYIHPMIGRDSKMTSSHNIRFPVFDEAGGTMVECQSSTTRGDHPYTTIIAHAHTPTFYISTKTWTPVLVVNHDTSILVGSYRRLTESVIDGKNVRVCLEEGGDSLFFCLNARFVTAKHTTDFVTAQLGPFMDPYATLYSDPMKCPKLKVLLVSSKGKVQLIPFSPGSADKEAVIWPFEKLHWFVEQD